MTPDDQTQPEDATRELLGAYALDAVDDVERRRVEKLLASGGAAQTELEQFEGVVDALGDAVEVDPPASLWTSIQNAIDAEGAVARSDTTEPGTNNFFLEQEVDLPHTRSCCGSGACRICNRRLNFRECSSGQQRPRHHRRYDSDGQRCRIETWFADGRSF